jgi:hypothetical protein
MAGFPDDMKFFDRINKSPLALSAELSYHLESGHLCVWFSCLTNERAVTTIKLSGDSKRRRQNDGKFIDKRGSVHASEKIQ